MGAAVPLSSFTWPHPSHACWLQAGFKQLYGDKYHIDVVDMATNHSPYPFNQASQSYNTMVRPSHTPESAPSDINSCSLSSAMVYGAAAESDPGGQLDAWQVKYPVLWRLGYGLTQPRMVHAPLQEAMRVITGRQVSEAFARYQPDLVVSVHPLMQVPLPPAPPSPAP